MYVAVARWCNQPSFFNKKSFREFVELDQRQYKSKCVSARALELIEHDFPEIAEEYFDLKLDMFDKNGNMK